TILKPLKTGEEHGPKGIFGSFPRHCDRGRRASQGAVKGIVRRSVRAMAVFGVLCIAMVRMFMRVPSSFLPEEDQGVLFSMVKAPVGATQERTMESIMKLEEHFLQNEQDTVESVFSVQGFSFGGSGQNNGMAF